MFRLVLDIVAGEVKNKASTAGIIIMRVQPHAPDVATNACMMMFVGGKQRKRVPTDMRCTSEYY